MLVATVLGSVIFLPFLVGYRYLRMTERQLLAAAGRVRHGMVLGPAVAAIGATVLVRTSMQFSRIRTPVGGVHVATLVDVAAVAVVGGVVVGVAAFAIVMLRSAG